MRIFITISLIVSVSLHAEIFKWVDKKGVTHYSESKPENIKATKFSVNSYENVSIEDVPTDNQFTPIERNPKLTRSYPKKVVMYSAQWCGVCKKAKKYFKNKRIRYVEYDIDKSKSAKARYKKLGATGVPVILVGKKRMNGFSVAGFQRIYK